VALGGGLNEDLPGRRLLALLLIAVLAVIVIADVFSTDYKVDPVVTGSMLGAIVSLVVVDVSKMTGGGK